MTATAEARVLPESLGASLDLEAIPMPPLFGWIARASRAERAELLRTFNCGIGMVAAATMREYGPGGRDACSRANRY